MKKFALELLYCDGFAEIDISTNYIIEADSQEEALSLANKQEYMVSKNISPYYDKCKDEIIIDILDNEYVNLYNVNHFQHIKDNSTGKTETFDTPDGTLTLSPIFDDDDFIKCSEKDFISYLKKNYEEYFKKNKILKFDCISYGVKEIGVNNKFIVIDESWNL